MLFGDYQFPIEIVVLIIILIAILIINIFFFHHESFSIKYKLMRSSKLFRTNQILTLLIQRLFNLSYIAPFLILVAIAILKGMLAPLDLPFLLVNGLILILIAFPLKRSSYLWKLGALFLLTTASQFVNLFVFSQNARSDYYTLLCSIFYPINSILFCLALLSREKKYWSIKDGIANPKVFEKLKNIYQGFVKEPQEQIIRSFSSEIINQPKQNDKIDQKYIQIPKEFDGGLFGYLRRGEKEKGRNYKFTVLYFLSLCVLGVNAVTVWKTSDSVLGVIGLVTNFIYDLFIFAFNNLDTPQRSVGNVFILVFVGRFLSFAFGEELWIFGFCILYFFVGIFVGQIIINDRLPLRNFNKEKKKSEDAFKTPQFVLFILTAEIICLVAASSFGIASSRTNVSYNEEVAVPLWQFAILMVGATWIVILILASIRIFRRYQNKIMEDTEYYFGSKQIQKHHIFGIITYLLILFLGLYCNFALKNKVVLYCCIFIPLIILGVVILLLEWIHNSYFITQNQELIKKRKIQQKKKMLKGVYQSKKQIQGQQQKMLKKVSLQEQQSQKQTLKEDNILFGDNTTAEFSSKIQNQLNYHQQDIQIQLDHCCHLWIRNIIITVSLLCVAFMLICYFVADSIFAIFFVICLISFLAPLPFYRLASTNQSLQKSEYIWFESGFVIGVIFWSCFYKETIYAMAWAGLNVIILSSVIFYGIIKRINNNNFMRWLGLNFLMTIIFISLFLAFTTSPFTAIAISAILLFICILLFPQAYAQYKNDQTDQNIARICWSLVIFGGIGLSLVAYLLNFFNSFAVLTIISSFCYLGLMAVAGILFYQAETNKYQSPHVYSAYGLPIYKFASRAEKIKSSKTHKVLFDFASAILVMYGAIISMIYSHNQLAIYLLGYYYSSSFIINMLFSLKTYSQLGEGKIDENLLLLTLEELNQRYMVTFKYNTSSSEVSKIKYKKKSEAQDSKTEQQLDRRWKEVAKLDLQYLLTREQQQKFLYFWILLIQFHTNANIKSKMVTFINYNKQIEEQLKAKGIIFDSLTYTLDFPTKFQLLCQQIDDLSHKDILTYKKMICEHMDNSENNKQKQMQRGKTIYKLQKQKQKNLLQKELDSRDRINEFNQIIERLGKKSLYVDRQFEQNASSLGELAPSVYKWRRPSSKQVLVHDQINADNARHGKINNSYFISSMRVLGKNWIQAALGMNVALGAKKWQNKKGAYMVRFYKFGKEFFVIVDDFLPVDQNNQYVFAMSNREDYPEIWPNIIQKAYAKFYGGYQNIQQGQCHRVLSELSGGVPFEILIQDFETNPYALWQKIIKYKQNQYLLGAGSNPHQAGEKIYSKRNILYGHAYSILDAKEVNDNKLIKLKNPQLNYYDSIEGQVEWNKEWNGDFSDTSKYMDDRMSKILKYKKQDKYDGIFWMKLQDFMHEFRSLYICKVFFGEFKKIPTIYGEFTRKNSYGLPHLSQNTFKNPQYGIKIKQKCTIFVMLTQENTNNQESNYIFMNIYKAKGKRISKYNKDQEMCIVPQKPSNKMVVTTQALLKSKSYPQTFTLYISCEEEGKKGKYQLQIFYKKGEVEVIEDNKFAREQFAD